MDYRGTLDYLESVQSRGIKLGLRNMEALLSGLGSPQAALRSVAVAGTNGKGSVCAFLSSLLRASGTRTGLYTSPHLVRYEERIAVDGRPVASGRFAAGVTEVKETIDALLAAGALDSHPTHFEVLTAAALVHFRAEKVETAVLEVGMGGRLDAVAAAGSEAAVVTNVRLEHTQHLGTTVEAIAREKAGIIGPRCRTAITSERHPEALAILRQTAALRGVRLVEAPLAVRARAAGGPGPPLLLRLSTARADYGEVELPLAGPHQVDNAAAAVLAAEALLAPEEGGSGLSPDAAARGLSSARWPGRFQAIRQDPLFVLDGAHNPAGAEALASALQAASAAGSSRAPLCLVAGILQEKDLQGIAAALFPLAAKVVATRGRSERFRDPEEIAVAARRLGVEASVERDLAGALSSAEAWRAAGGAVCLCGSLYLVGDAMEALGIDPF